MHIYSYSIQYSILYSICVEFKSIIVNIYSNNNTVNLFKVMFYARTLKLFIFANLLYSCKM